jgi:prepilin peptidase CpaA
MVVPAQFVYVGAAVVFAGVASVHDVREARIPNKLTGPGILAGLLLHLTLGGPKQLGWSLLAGVIAGFTFFLFYMAGGMGAGDVKLITAVGCIAGISSIKEVLLATVIIGGVFAVALALYRGKLRQTANNVVSLVAHHQANGLTAHPELNLSNKGTLRLPYALPIALGCLFALCIGPLGSATR